jgi:hypothetical protein
MQPASAPPLPTAVAEPGAPLDAGTAVLALSAGLGMALLCALAWAAVVAATKYEIGFLATLVGFACAWAVHRVAKARRTDLALGAAALGLVAIAIGKFLGTGLLLLREIGAGLLDAEMWSFHADYMLHHLGSFLDGYDVLWVALAILAAWRQLGPRKAVQAAAHAPTPR